MEAADRGGLQASVIQRRLLCHALYGERAEFSIFVADSRPKLFELR